MTHSERFARAVSVIFFPAIFAPLGVATFLLIDSSVSETVFWSLAGIGFFLIPLSVLAAYMSYFKGLSIHNRNVRNPQYVFAVLLVSVFTFLLYVFQAPVRMLEVSIALTVGAAVFGVLNQRMKISLHTGSVAAVAGLHITNSILAGSALVLAALVVGWSRIELERHTWKEVAAGFAVGLLTGLAAVLF